MSPSSNKFALWIVLAVAFNVSAVASADDALRPVYVEPARHLPADVSCEEAKGKIRQMLDRMTQQGVNTVWLYSASMDGKAYYQSQVLPQRYFTKCDILKTFLEVAESTPIDVWACANVLGGHGAYGDPVGILDQKPEWCLHHAEENRPLGFISPGNADARRWVRDWMLELASNYDLAGIQYDMLRFPNRPVKFDALTRKQNPPPESGPARQRYKEQLLNTLVAEIHSDVKAVKPEIKIGNYTWGAYVLNNYRTSQRWDIWVKQGWIDAVDASGYYFAKKYGDEVFEVLSGRMTECAAAIEGHHEACLLTCTIGVETSHGKIETPELLKRYIQTATAVSGIDGISFYTWEFLDDRFGESVTAETWPASNSN